MTLVVLGDVEAGDSLPSGPGSNPVRKKQQLEQSDKMWPFAVNSLARLSDGSATTYCTCELTLGIFFAKILLQVLINWQMSFSLPKLYFASNLPMQELGFTAKTNYKLV